MARLLRTATRNVGSPKYLITDQGREFTGTVFAKTAALLGIVHRFGSTKNIFATARLERFWRTLRQALSLRLHPPLTIGDLERRLDVALTHYLRFRPHQGLSVREQRDRGWRPSEAMRLFTSAARIAARSLYGIKSSGETSYFKSDLLSVPALGLKPQPNGLIGLHQRYKPLWIHEEQRSVAVVACLRERFHFRLAIEHESHLDPPRIVALDCLARTDKHTHGTSVASYREVGRELLIFTADIYDDLYRPSFEVNYPACLTQAPLT